MDAAEARSTPQGSEQTDGPSMLDLVRLSPRPLFPPGGEDLYRQIAILTGMGRDTEVLDVGCGAAVSLEYFVREYGVHGSGVDQDPRLVEQAADRARRADLGTRLQVQEAASNRLPYVDAIFDVTVGELAMTAGADPEEAVRELVRVTRPGGFVVLVQLAWKAPVDQARRDLLSRHLGVKPLMLVEWKRMLRDAGMGEVHTEDWSNDQTAFRAKVAKPFPDFAELFSISEKIGIMRRAWGRWGWSGVRTAIAREWEVHRLLTKDRILGLDLLRARKPGAEEAADADHAAVTSAAERGSGLAGSDAPAPPPQDPESEGLPLFGGKTENR